MKKILFILVMVFLFSIFVGRYTVVPWKIGDLEKSILFKIRFPRILAVMLSGASLSLAGLTFQNLFRNYLAGPGILGVTSGSAFGAAVAILLFYGSAISIQFFAFICGVLAVVVTYGIARKIGGSNLSLILSGMVVSAFFSASLGLIKYLADPQNVLPTIVYWLLGSFVGIRWSDLTISLPIFFVGIPVLLMMSWVMNVISTGDEEAKALGLNVKLFRIILIGLATLVTSATTSMAGMITWIGVLSPHIARLLVGFDNRKLVPYSAMIGAILLLICDDIARTLVPAELPLSVVTNFIGAPALFYALLKQKGVFYVKD